MTLKILILYNKYLLLKIKYSEDVIIRNSYINKIKRQLAFRSFYHIIHLLAFDTAVP